MGIKLPFSLKDKSFYYSLQKKLKGLRFTSLIQEKYFPFLVGVIALVPTALAITHFVGIYHQIESDHNQLSFFKLKAKNVSLFEERKKEFLDQFQTCDRYYLDNTLSKLSFLQEEEKTLRRFINHSAFKQSSEMNRRHQFITGDLNRLQFHEIKREANKALEETLERQLRPVEMNETDIKRVLSLIEGIDAKGISETAMASRPQLLIRSLHISKKKMDLGREVYLFSSELIKRVIQEKK